MNRKSNAFEEKAERRKEKKKREDIGGPGVVFISRSLQSQPLVPPAHKIRSRVDRRSALSSIHHTIS
uniref:Uncharacterized protein n=1 Tax=Caenorhabditis japonica TaxID=281687 RepID=A0A8R1ESW9_CAEJA